MIEELDRVVLTENLPERHLTAGDLGVVVLIHGEEVGYTVEFVTLEGETVAVLFVYAHQVRPIESGEIAHVRKLAPA